MITVEKMRDTLNILIDKGLGNRYISVADYYLDDNYNEGDDLWNTIQFGEIHQSDIPVTEEQQKDVDVRMEKLRLEKPELFELNKNN